MSLVTPSLTYWPNPNTGKPLFNGYVYVGEPDTDPEIESNQKQVTLRLEDGTNLNVGQPLRLSEGGVLQYNGSYAVITTEGRYSVKALDRRMTQALYIPSNDGLFDASQVNVSIDGTETNVEEYLNASKIFPSVLDMTQMSSDYAEMLSSIDATIITSSYYSGTNIGGGFYKIKTLAQSASDGDDIDGYGNHYIGGGAYTAILNINGPYLLTQFGVKHRLITDLVTPVQDNIDAVTACFTAARAARGTVVGGVGSVYVGSTVEISTDFDGSAGTVFTALNDFTGDDVCLTTTNSVKIRKLTARPWSTASRVAGQTGLRVNTFNVKTEYLNSLGFDYGLAINSFSYTGLNGVVVSNNTNVTAWAPETNQEINSCIFIGGEYWGGRDFAFNFGDDRFTSPISLSATQGNTVKLIGMTTDAGVMRFDRVTNVEVSCYFEGGDSTYQNAYIHIVNTNGVMQGFHVHDCSCANQGGTMDYFLYCENQINGLSVENIQYTGIPKCAVYARGSLYAINVRGLMATASHTEAPAVHIGANAGTTNPLGLHTIQGFMANGMVNGLAGNARRTRTEQEEANRTAFYATTAYGYIKVDDRSSNISGSVISSNVFRVSDLAEIKNFNGAQCVNIDGVKAYILRVDYETGDIHVSNYTLSTQTEISHDYVDPRVEFYDYQMPTTTTGYALGSVCWNVFTVDFSTVGWILKTGGWTAM